MTLVQNSAETFVKVEMLNCSQGTRKGSVHWTKKKKKKRRKA